MTIRGRTSLRTTPEVQEHGHAHHLLLFNAGCILGRSRPLLVVKAIRLRPLLPHPDSAAFACACPWAALLPRKWCDHPARPRYAPAAASCGYLLAALARHTRLDRKSTRELQSLMRISYAVFC